MKLFSLILVTVVLIGTMAPGTDAFFSSIGNFFANAGKAIWQAGGDVVEIIADDVFDVQLNVPDKGTNECGDYKKKNSETNFMGFSGYDYYYECCGGWQYDSGNRCLVPICSGSRACGSRGKCKTSPGNCECYSGYTGSSTGCNTYVCLYSYDCGNRGTCTAANTCTCKAGYSGINVGCTTDVNECTSGAHNCDHTCTNTVGSFTCSCNSGYQLVGGNKCENINECTANTHNCAHVCTDNTPGFTCSCNSGYSSLNGGVTCTDVDECTAGTHNCAETCSNTAGSFECSCPSGMTLINGKDCEDKDECQLGTHQCESGCVNNHGSYSCSCPAGYNVASDGFACEDDNECDSNPCGIHTCNNNEGSYTCTCNTGYHSSTTTTCVDTNECVSGHECDQQCTNNEGSYTCSCGSGYLLDSNGKACNDINECDNNPCHLQADCGNTDGSFTCACFEGYLGDGFNCQPICEYNCLNGGECVEPNTCQCTERFQGPVCAEPVCDECVNGVCVAETDVNVCSCSEGYKGTSCSEDIDECTEETHRCSDICINTVGSFECDCPTGYKLDDTGFTCTDHNECEGDDHGCDICFNLIGSYHCVCELGYQLIAPENKKCEDTDECTMETDICEQVCINKPGGYDCDCNVGYQLEGDEFNCEDVDECAMSTHNCDHGCSNTDGSFTCFCDNGYELGEDGASCLDINECELNTHDCEHICNNNVGSYVCECNAGYSLMENGASCENINECELGTPCHAELGICDDTIGSYECSCVEGYHGDGVDCTDIDECETETHDCHHNCENNPGSFDCSCEEGFHLTEDLKTCREIVNLWTVSRTGCPCYWDKTRTADCACCIEGGCQCTSKNPNKCVQCGYGEDCKYDIMEEAAPCFFNRTRRVSRLVTDLVKPMSCDLRGRYKAKQCEGSKCWCVNTMGHKIPGTEKSGEHRHQLDCENLYFLNGWTAAATGCECPFDKTRKDCACCAEGGCFCGEIDIHMCTQCGITRNCDSLHEDYPPDLRFPML